jgi:hypothetical protein
LSDAPRPLWGLGLRLSDKFCCFPNWTNHQMRWASVGIGLICQSSLT